MKKLVLISTILILGSLCQAQSAWKPIGFEKLDSSSQLVINNLSSTNEANKSMVQLLLDSGKYANCAMGTALRKDALYLSVIDKANHKRYNYVMNLRNALVSNNPFNSKGRTTYILVFDQPNSKYVETIFIYFYFSAKGHIENADILSYKNEGYSWPLISKYTSKTTPYYYVGCRGQ